MPAKWSITGTKDDPHIRPDWTPLNPLEISGVVIKRIDNVPTDNGYLTEIWREEWGLDGEHVDQVFQRVLEPGASSGWHAHELATDRLFCSYGRLKVGLYDGRLDAPTHGIGMDLRIGAERPALVVIPPGVWHAVRNIGTGPALYVNVVGPAYDYNDPDHFREPADSSLIPIEI